MARGTQLEELVNMLRAEAGHSTLVSAGIDNLPALKQTIRRVQEVLADDYDWPFLRYEPYKNLNAGQRFYDMPTAMDFERIEAVVVWYDGQPHLLERGIGPEEYAQYDSENDDRAGPPMRWDWKYTDDTDSEQIEVWPIPPASDTYRLQFYGFRRLNALVQDSDTADLDDQLIVLTAASEILARQKSEDAPLKQRMAKARFDQLKSRTKGGSSITVMGGGSKPQSLRGQTIIRVGRS